MTNGGILVEQRTIVLLPFPYSDLSSTKQRPGLIISDREYNTLSEDVICCLITSNPMEYKYSVSITNNDLDDGHLRYDSKVKPDRIFTLHQSRIIRKFGKLNEVKCNEVIENINKIIEIKE